MTMKTTAGRKVKTAGKAVSYKPYRVAALPSTASQIESSRSRRSFLHVNSSHGMYSRLIFLQAFGTTFKPNSSTKKSTTTCQDAHSTLPPIAPQERWESKSSSRRSLDPPSSQKWPMKNNPPFCGRPMAPAPLLPSVSSCPQHVPIMSISPQLQSKKWDENASHHANKRRTNRNLINPSHMSQHPLPPSKEAVVADAALALVELHSLNSSSDSSSAQPSPLASPPTLAPLAPPPFQLR